MSSAEDRHIVGPHVTAVKANELVESATGLSLASSFHNNSLATEWEQLHELV